MSGIFPEPKEVILFVCEDVRVEQNNKLTLIGLYVGNSLKVKEIGPLVSIPLALLIMVNGGEGEFDMQMSIISPSEKVVVATQPQKIIKEKNQTAVQVIKFMNFALQEVGPFRVNFSLDGKKYPLRFVIEHDPNLTSP